jgi:hypothetical protein
MSERKSTAAKRQPPTPEQIRAEQKRQAEKGTPALEIVSVPATVVTAGTAVEAPDNRTSVQRYIDEIAPPGSIVGRLVRFSKEGRFVTSDDDAPVDEKAEFIVLCDQTLVGWIRFHADGETPPDRIMGILYDGFVLPPREKLGDLDPAKWPIGLSGKPEDVWKHQNCVVLQQAETRELFTFATTSETGRRAVGNLLRHYERMKKTNADELPVVRLRAGGFNHRDARIGWVPTPMFAVVGRAPRDSAVKPDTSVAGDMNDQVPF